MKIKKNYSNGKKGLMKKQMNYLMNYRLSQARNFLIERPDESIREISADCGFKSEAHFSRFFKKNIGITPSEYRKNNIEQGEM